MLFENTDKISIGDITSVRLTSGEELVGKVISISDRSLTLTKPIHILAGMQPNGSIGIQFAPFMVSVAEDSSFVFDFNKLSVSPIKTNPEIKKNYISATSPIVQPTAPGLVMP